MLSLRHILKKFSAPVLFVIACIGINATGCATFGPHYETPRPVEQPKNKAKESESKSKEDNLIHYANLPPAEGSLWTENGMLLFVDDRARRVGDTIIVDIVENTSSSMAANTQTSRESTLSGDIPNLLGGMRGLEAKNPNLRNGGDSNLLSASLSSDHTGKGTSDRSGRITASIGATVMEVLPNGNVVIFGKRDMEVNNEIQKITVAGVIRPEDIGSDNRIQSTYLAEAQISYSGQGALADRQRPGWGMRILDYVWPF